MTKEEQVWLCYVKLFPCKMGDFYNNLKNFFSEKWNHDCTETELMMWNLQERGLITVKSGCIVLTLYGYEALTSTAGAHGAEEASTFEQSPLHLVH